MTEEWGEPPTESTLAIGEIAIKIVVEKGKIKGYLQEINVDNPETDYYKIG